MIKIVLNQRIFLAKISENHPILMNLLILLLSYSLSKIRGATPPTLVSFRVKIDPQDDLTFLSTGLDSLRRRRESPFETDYLGNVDTNKNSDFSDDIALSPFSYNGDDRADFAQSYLNIEQLLALDPETSDGLKQLSPDLYDVTEPEAQDDDDDDEEEDDDKEEDDINVYEDDEAPADDYQMGEDKDDDDEDDESEPVLDFDNVDAAIGSTVGTPESVLDIDYATPDEGQSGDLFLLRILVKDNCNRN
jgi:hypothetical protein